MTEAPQIGNYKLYNARMELSMMDKLFFLDKIAPDLLVDFGCADGALLRTIRAVCPDLNVVGYDNNPVMVNYSTDDVPIDCNWAYIMQKTAARASSAVLLCSVIHEVAHYGSKGELDDFWGKVFESEFEYIVIRDMVPSRGIERPSCINDVKKVYRRFLGTKALDDFERIWGSIENNKQLVHFLLKYKYLEPNWDREVRENYLPITREALLAKIPDEYDVIFHEHYVLPYLLQTVRADFGIELKDPTHLKLILRRRK